MCLSSWWIKMLKHFTMAFLFKKLISQKKKMDIFWKYGKRQTSCVAY